MPTDFRQERRRAISALRQLLITHSDSQRLRGVLFRNAFAGENEGVLGQIRFEGELDLFCPDAVDALVRAGYTEKGRHFVSLMLDAILDMSLGEYKTECEELQVAFDSQWPEARRELLKYVLTEGQRLAMLYSPLGGHAEVVRGETGPDHLIQAWSEDPAIQSLLTYFPREESGLCERLSYVDVLEAFAVVRRAALVGDPGAGKSTTLCRLAVNLAQTAIADSKTPLPLLIHLNRWKGPESFRRFLAHQSPGNAWAVAELWKGDGKIVLLLDGLNEIPTDGRARKIKQIKDYLAKAVCRSASVFVSCRRNDYTDELNLGLDLLTIEPLSPLRIRAAVRRWVENAGDDPAKADRFFWQLAGGEKFRFVLEKWKYAGATEEEFWDATDPKQYTAVYKRTTEADDALFRQCRGPRSLLHLASNPFLLTMLWIVWISQGQRLPDNRGQLFQGFVASLLVNEELGALESKHLVEGLTRLAWQMQTDRVASGPAEGDDFGVLTVVSRSEAVKFVGSEKLLQYALDSTLLEGSEDLCFRHQLLQEYFTARALQIWIGANPAAKLWLPKRWWKRNGWEETAVLLAGFVGEGGLPVITWLRDAQPEVTAQCIRESGVKFNDESSLQQDLYGAWMPRLLEEAQPEARAAVGRALGRLKLDDRPGVGLTTAGLPDIDWVEIPEGEFLFGEANERLHLDGFSISRYPITNCQYQAFLVAADGYVQDQWWVGLSGAKRSPHEPNWSESNHPRENVSWYEATAFCRWLSVQSASSVALPTEEQWERAARGGTGRAHPWGKEDASGCANVDETMFGTGPYKIGRTSAVGLYPDGASPEGVMDLIGNVWEWCHDRPAAEMGSRVLRGGSWVYAPRNAQGGDRSLGHPGGRRPNVGFRVVLLMSPPPLTEGSNSGRCFADYLSPL